MSLCCCLWSGLKSPNICENIHSLLFWLLIPERPRQVVSKYKVITRKSCLPLCINKYRHTQRHTVARIHLISWRSASHNCCKLYMALISHWWFYSSYSAFLIMTYFLIPFHGSQRNISTHLLAVHTYFVDIAWTLCHQNYKAIEYYQTSAMHVNSDYCKNILSSFIAVKCHFYLHKLSYHLMWIWELSCMANYFSVYLTNVIVWRLNQRLSIKVKQRYFEIEISFHPFANNVTGR